MGERDGCRRTPLAFVVTAGGFAVTEKLISRNCIAGLRIDGDVE